MAKKTRLKNRGKISYEQRNTERKMKPAYKFDGTGLKHTMSLKNRNLVAWCLCYLYDNIWFLLCPLPTGLFGCWELSVPSVTDPAALWIFSSRNFLSALQAGCLHSSSRTTSGSVLHAAHSWLLLWGWAPGASQGWGLCVPPAKLLIQKYLQWCHTCIKDQN